MITELKENEIFVFGSNRAGRHGAGAAKLALKFGAKYGVGEGLVGQTYALPTKDEKIQTLPLSEIQKHIDKFLLTAEEHPDLLFLLTKIGCGLAGYDWDEDIRPMFPDKFPDNIKRVYFFKHKSQK